MATTERLITQIIIKGADKANRQMNSLDSSVGSMAKSFVGIGALALAAGKAIQFIGGSAKLLREDNREYSKMQAVIKTTGGSAGYTASQLVRMANEIQNLTGVSNTEINSSQAMLLTFKQIGEETFPRAIQAIVDMSAVQGDLRGNTLSLGKALNDPIKGVTALSRVGVQFTNEQKNQIAVLQKSGDMLGAQNVILKELEGQFKGSAKAISQNTDLLKVSFDDFRKRLAVNVEPAIQGVAGMLKTLIDIPVDEQIRREKDEFNALVGILKDSTTETGLRNEAIKQLQEKYPEYLKNLNLETATTKELAAAQKLSNEEFDKTIKQKVNDYFINKVKKSIAETEASILSLEISLESMRRKNIGGRGFAETANALNYTKDALMSLQKKLYELENRDVASDSYTAMFEAWAKSADKIKPKPIEQTITVTDTGYEEWKTKLEEMENKSKEVLDFKYKLYLDDRDLFSASGFKIEDLLGFNPSDIQIELWDSFNMPEEVDDIVVPLTIDVTQLDKLPVTLDIVKSKASEIASAFGTAFTFMSNAISAYGDMWNAEMDNEIESLKHTDEYKEASSDKRVIMEQKITDKYKDEKKKQWVVEKAFNVSKAIIDTTSAVIEALPNYVLATAVGIFGAAQTAFIANTPAPAFAMGGDFITNGPQMILVGDNPGGRERVSITPTSSTNYRGPKNYGDVDIEKAIREGIAKGLSSQPHYNIVTIDDITLNKRNEAGAIRRGRK